MLTTVFSILTGLCALLAIVGWYRGGPPPLHGRRLHYVFKPLTMVWIILIALTADDPVSTTYQVLIVLGLLASVTGDVFLMLEDRFLEGLVSFLVAHLMYIAAFTLAGDGTAPIAYIIPFVLYGVIILWLLWPHLGSMRPPVMVYTGVILIMAWQAANRWIETDQPGTMLALVGAYLFVASDSALAFDRFRGTWRSARFWVLSLYYVGQWLIALSV